MNKDINNNKQRIELSIIPFLAEGFSTNKKIYKEIDKIYNTDKIKFIEAAKQDIYYNHPMACEGNIQQEYYFKKSLGVLNVSKENEYIAEEIINICKKGWKYAYTYVQQQNNIKLSLFLDRYVRKNKGIDNVSDDELNSNILIVLFLAQQSGKTIDEKDKLYIDAIKSYIIRIQHYEKENRININDISKEKKKQLRELELKIKNERKIQYIPSSYRFNSDQYDNLKINIDKLSADDKYFSGFEYIFDLENISLISIAGEKVFNTKEIQELIFCYTQFFRIDTDKEKYNEPINYEELRKFIYPAIQIRYLAREYKKAKEFFFQNFDEELYQEISKVEIENKDVKKSNLLLQDENQQLKLELKEFKRENKRLKQEISERDSNKTELKALREFVFNLEIDTPITEDKPNYDELNEYRGVIIGGHNSWQNKLKEILTDWNFISVDAINFDENILKNSDYIFINTGYLSHTMYYRVMSIIGNSDKKIYFINKQNIQLCLEDIWNKINDN